MNELMEMVDKLCRASREDYINPYTYLEWPETLDFDQWFFSPELLSLYGMPVYTGLSEAQQHRLSFCETVNFFSLNIHGEKSLVEGLAHRVYQSDLRDLTPYLHHFLDEENKHMVYFGGFCLRYAGELYPDKKLVFPRQYAPGEENFLFFARVLIFEEIVDAYNLLMARDLRLPPIVRQINLGHHLEESRHLAFGRLVVRELFRQYAPSWSADTLAGVQEYLQSYLTQTWREYYNPDVYRDAGLPEPRRVQEQAFNHPSAQEHRRRISAKLSRFLEVNSILDEVRL
jgi:hypothetical protein